MDSKKILGNARLNNGLYTFFGKQPLQSQAFSGSISSSKQNDEIMLWQRVLSPFSSAAAAGGLQAPAQTDASSGDTNSFQDDQSTLHVGLCTQNSLEAESIWDFERQLPYDCARTPTKPKKKKKAKNLGSAYSQGWQLESPVHNEQGLFQKETRVISLILTETVVYMDNIMPRN